MRAGNVKWVRLGDYISQRRENNSSLKYGIDLIEGVNSDGEFQPTKALTDNINLKPYKVVRHGDIVYNPSRLNIGSLAYRTGNLHKREIPIQIICGVFNSLSQTK